MQCRNCGTEIADKAIVCYRCGTATTDAVRKPAEVRPRRRRTLLPLFGLMVLLIASLYMGQAARTASSWHAGPAVWIVYVVALSIALTVVLFRHLRR
jgi:hypothetical protein